MNTMQAWMEDEVRAAIAKALESEPEGPDRDYWTTETSLKEIKAKYGLKRFKPKPITVTLVRECFGKKFVHVLTARESGICPKDPTMRRSRMRQAHGDPPLRQVRRANAVLGLRAGAFLFGLVPRVR